MYRIAICDDSQESIAKIHARIERYVQTHKAVLSERTYTDPKMLLEDLEDGVYFDIIFMDIEMPGMDGLQAIRAIKEMHADSLIVIVSGYQRYTISAIELDVFRYLVKGQLEPSFDDYLEAALRRVDLNSHANYFILSARKQIKIACRDIIYCYKEAKMSVIVTASEEIRERKPLQNLLGDLQINCDYFVMIERGYIVNLYYVEKLEKNVIYLENNLKLPVGFTYVDEVKKQLNTFWRKRL